MSYEEILNILKNVSQTVNPSGHFTNGRKPDGSFDFSPPYPIINLRTISKRTDRRNGLVTYNITLLFFKEDDARNPISVMEQNIFDMDKLCDDYMNELFSHPKLQVEIDNAIPEHRVPGGKTSGFGVNFTVITRTQC